MVKCNVETVGILKKEVLSLIELVIIKIHFQKQYLYYKACGTCTG